MSSLSLALEILGRDLSGGAFASVLARLGALDAAASGAGNDGSTALGGMNATLMAMEGIVIGAGIAFIGFAEGMKAAIETGAQLQQAGIMASIAISDGAQHVGELENAIVNMANNSQYKIADVDMAFRILGGLGFDTAQILGGLGQEAIILAQAMGGPGAGVSAADAAQLLGQAIYLFGSRGLTAARAADILTGAFYNNMMSVSGLTEFLGMAGGTASSLGVSFDQLMTFGSMLTPMFGSASSAGASLAYMMRNLAAPSTSKIADEIQHLGLKIYDSQGNFVGLKNIMDQLFADTANMTQQQKMDVFGTLFNVRSGRAAMDLMSQTQAQFDATYQRIDTRLTQTNQAQKDSNSINNSGIGVWNQFKTTLNDFFAKTGVGIVTALIPLGLQLNHLLSLAQQNPTLMKFFGVFLIAGVALSALALIVGAIVAGFVLFGSVVGVAIAVVAGLVANAGLLAGMFMMLSSKADIFSGNLSFLNGIVNFFRAAWSLVVSMWQNMVFPLFERAAPMFKIIGIALLAIVAIIVGLLIGAFLAVALAITAVVVILGLLFDVIQWVIQQVIRLWDALYGGVLSLLPKVSVLLHQIGDTIKNILGNLGQAAFQWGKDLIQGLINGIMNMMGGVQHAVGGISQVIGNFLHHSTPDEGPLKGDDQWGAELVHNFASGMVSQLPTLRSATGQVASTLTGGLSLSPSAGIVPTGGNLMTSQGGQQVVIPIYIGQDLVAEYGYNTVTQQLTMNGMGRQYR